jgi:hypothetical protein
MDTPLISEQEVDSDVNEDPKRERLLDGSFQAFMDSLDEELCDRTK